MPLRRRLPVRAGRWLKRGSRVVAPGRQRGFAHRHATRAADLAVVGGPRLGELRRQPDLTVALQEAAGLRHPVQSSARTKAASRIRPSPSSLATADR